VNIHAPQNSSSGFERELREGHLKIAQSHAPKPAKAPVNSKGNAAREEARNATRHAAQAARNGYNQPILEAFQHE
jgi:hypothetical protein